MPITTEQKTITKPKPTPSLFAAGHRGCAGCGQMLAARTVINALGTNTIIANATGCLEVTTTPYPESAWGVPWIHSLFENPAAVASGILAGLKQKGKDKKVKILVQGGDGGTFDIGFGLISGMWERGENILYVCYDNEAYSNTGMQASGATPWASNTTTTPAGSGTTIDAIGSHQSKKDMIAIALAHGVKYVAQCTTGYLEDIEAKVKKAATIEGPSYIQILAPCIPGWHIKPDQAMSLSRLATQTGLYPLLEYTDGALTKVMPVPANTPRVEEYLKPQGRFSHLFKGDHGKELIAQVQALADGNILKYGLKKVT
ncbi:MAG: Pyruvate oxidoreductase subunit beta [Candidatus Falkowbacteria bacterium GW2011_GWC2_38_22]|uniref:Pyruvate oxidoreductase subunit beta n=1 Tax=Candidatus Falkowbacteria bacterium GW2011_GWE1_38_31 TaxID=1618638 RepID=A0A0G0JUH5_9BACT|nr:MAG: Pyruvate oxidoreductase subunit beta [Candidatus Falkowbacteria bacterium GW2011_GWF2_38_1205]KKQ61544.1 MAG: Pyruvate oxidoreductase subunit beta [Candidatus Falkowbacteria bacterium GW2011_GWC2_38_22]KKQ63563.1 MAG: Pyruvate oxidoreductase subunit beta [Candidatus Falkowbacteria bacterium GW2011_GWF1_38_22]KKQ65715.1 MAG: Pyruvate oxidoreductase subunit beta [Candidatus Falkowbacteria bacterium GW2011_GWE2_38_254]KKQ70332.1 MAG: Pyruvate oxidoreductase subunit beta [Candidatus Falkowb